MNSNIGHIVVSPQCLLLFAYLAKLHYTSVNLYAIQLVTQNVLLAFRFNFDLVKSLCETMTKIAHYDSKSCYLQDVSYLCESIFELNVTFLKKYGYHGILMDWLFENIQSVFLKHHHFMYCYDEITHVQHGGFENRLMPTWNREVRSNFKRICKCLITKMDPYALYMEGSMETKGYYYVFKHLFLIKLNQGTTMKILLDVIQAKGQVLNVFRRLPLEMIRMLKDFLI
jgi:hypothetical protein